MAAKRVKCWSDCSALERLLSVCFEADQIGIDALESKECDAGSVEILG